MAATPILTQMRVAAWDALDAWPTTQAYFKRRWRFEGDEAIRAAEIQPAIGDLPAIAIEPAGGSNPWALNQEQHVTLSLTINVWLAKWDLNEAERLWERIAIALFQATTQGSSVPVIKRVTGFYPTVNGLSHGIGTLADGNKCTLLSIPVTLEKLGFNPRIDTGV
jgi:hypothetical protein